MQLPLPLDDFAPDPAPQDVPRRQRIYVNRSLRFDLVSTVGFDMDYTLATYRQPEMDRVSIEVTLLKLVEKGYPDFLLHIPYRTDFPIRGLLIDRALGNVVKMDRYRYVKKAYHGLRELSRKERHYAYHAQPIRAGSERYHWVDTLYALSEVAVFSAAIDACAQVSHQIDPGRLFDEIRASIDEAHQDGSLIGRILEDPERFIERDPDLGPTLHKLRSAGKRTFLLTNSHADYTDRIMRFLLEGELREYPTWRAYFDVIVTAAKKPFFFVASDAAFHRVGHQGAVDRFERGELYAGGCLDRFRELLGAFGDQVLYVGDHIYGDVLRAKKETAWRTAMVIQEMGKEMRVLRQVEHLFQRIDQLESVRDRLHEEMRGRRRALRRVARFDGRERSARRARHHEMIDHLKARLRRVDRELNELEQEADQCFHPFWGSLFKAGSEVSLFGDQVEQYACLYMDRVSNLLHYSPLHYFRSPRDRMPHEL